MDARILGDIETISKSRNFCSADAISGAPGSSWRAVASGIFVTVLPYFVHRPQPVHVLRLSPFAIYNDTVI